MKVYPTANKSTSTIAYADCFSGISGDMFLGALIDCGMEEKILLKELSKLKDIDFQLVVEPHHEYGIKSTKVEIQADINQSPRKWIEIKTLLKQSNLEDTIKEQSLAVFNLLAKAEADVHGCRMEDVHFHEVGAVDTIVDIVGTVTGLRHFGVNRLVSSPLPMPRGWVKCDHGLLPVPAPAVCEILKNTPVYGLEESQELVTPTGAALIRSLSHSFGQFPPMSVQQTGYGAGSYKLQGNKPNLFRLILGNEENPDEAQEVEVIETNIDDCSPEVFPYLMEQFFAKGALDVTITAVQMKKGRPGFLLQIICSPAHAQSLKDCILSETTAIGLRYRREKRVTLPRSLGKVDTPWGGIKAKKVLTPGGPVIYPEYEDCRIIAMKNGIPLNRIYSTVAGQSLEGFVEDDKGSNK